MKRTFLIILALILFTLISCTNTAESGVQNKTSLKEMLQLVEANQVEYETFTKESLEEDFNDFVELIERHHPMLYTDKEVTNNMIDKNRAKIVDGMTCFEFLRLLSPITSSLNCGHTRITLSRDQTIKFYDEDLGFPLQTCIIDNKIYCIDSRFEQEIPAGSEIISINGRSSFEILSILLDSVPADGQNLSFKYHFLNDFFRRAYYEYVDESSQFVIEFKENEKSEVKCMLMSGTLFDEYRSNQLSEYVPYTSQINEEYGIIEFDSFYPEGSYSLKDYKDFIDDFFKKIRDRNIGTIIVDVRDNGGGEPRVTSHLFSYLARYEQPYFAKDVQNYYSELKENIQLQENNFSGTLYVLMNGGSFSSTGHLLSLLKHQNIGIFIGEESGGSFACTDSSQSKSLNYTGLYFRYSTQAWSVAVDDITPGRGIIPDYYIQYSVHDYLENRDLEMDYVINELIDICE